MPAHKGIDSDDDWINFYPKLNALTSEAVGGSQTDLSVTAGMLVGKVNKPKAAA